MSDIRWEYEVCKAHCVFGCMLVSVDPGWESLETQVWVCAVGVCVGGMTQ